MRQRRRRRRSHGMKASRRRGRTRDEEAAMRQTGATTTSCREAAARRAGNESGLVDCFSGDCRGGHTNLGLVCGRQSMGSAASCSALMKTTKQSDARQLSADLSHHARGAHTNRTASILLALTATLACCNLAPNPSATTWQVHGQLFEGSHRQNEEITRPRQTIVIKTPQGQLMLGSRRPGEGARDGDVAEFLGVRYASAPVKRLRFMPPTPFTYAKGPLHDLTQPGPICMQRIPLEVTRAQRQLIGQYLGQNPATNETIDHRLELMRATLLAGASENDRLVRSKLGRFAQSEDCLNLNVYTPIEALNRRQVAAPDGGNGEQYERDTREQQSDAGDQQRSQTHNNATTATTEQLPVLVLVHGHSFDFGSGSLLEAREFARDNRLIVITLNYRLNVLGFPPKFGAASRANLGLLDQVAALHWIRANIRSFGGAPENITLMGYKRGAIFVHLLMLSPLAKGLFQRAVLEDGTALSPVVANNLLAANSQHQQQHVALAHLHALAHLCGCPLSLAANSTTDRGQPSGGEQEQRATTNSLVFECLRSKPGELLVQHIPSDLIDLTRLGQPPPGLGSAAAEDQQVLPIASKWRAPLERIFELLSKEELKRRVEAANGSDESSTTTTTGVNQLQVDEFKRLFESSPGSSLAIKPDQLNRLAALLVVKLGEHRAEPRLSELITNVLGALYLPSNETLPIGPVFAPQLEPGTLVGLAPAALDGQLPESDQLANAMLQRDSLFGQRDLMVGLSTPLVDFSTTRQVHDEAPSLPSPRDLPLERPQAGRLLELGLTEEQAIGQVNLFVRSFYRFHQQEISNSIVNQYMSNKNNNNNKDLPSVDDATNVVESNVATEERAKVMARSKRLFLLRSLQELYADALVQVPMLKTVLIHSLRQLDLLADQFVAQQLDRMRAIMDEPGGHAADSLWDGPTAAALSQLLEPRQLQENFYTFVKSFYRAASVWPIRLQPPPVNADTRGGSLEINRPRSTFLYQFAGPLKSALKTKLSHRLQFVLTQLERHPIARGRQRSAMQELKAVLMKLIDEINGHQVAVDDEFEFNFSCSLGDWSESGSSLLRKLDFWICREQIGRTLANFVRTGNANEARPSGEREDTNQYNGEITARLERYQSECIGDQPERADSNQDHLVQLAGESAITSGAKRSENYEILVEQAPGRDESKLYSCRNRIQSLAYSFLMKFEFLQESNRRPQDWLMFNVFGQQLANFNLAAMSSPADAGEFSLESFVSSASSQREPFNSKVAFWANFIPALNCSRTQPIGAQSLSLFSQANSTLLNMNLNFNCQQQQQHSVAPKTASSMLQSMLARIRHELTEQMRAHQRSMLGARNQLASSAAGPNSSNQNHHLPRMANMSTSQQPGGFAPSQLDEMVADSTQNNNNNNQIGNLAQNWLTAVGGGGGGTSSPVSLARRAFAFISRQSASVAFWLLSAVFLLVILVVLVSGLAVARQWKSVRARLRKRRGTGGGGSGGGNNSGEHISEHSPASLQLDASFLQELEHQASRQEQLVHQTSSLDQTGDFRQQQRSPSTNFMSTPSLVHEQDASPRVPEDRILLPPPPPMLTNGLPGQSSGDDDECGGGEHQMRTAEPRHLPTCNLVRMNNLGNQQTGGGLLTSSTSSETTNGRAHSSVSLVSTSGTLTGNAAARGSVASVATIKKRVKISDPKRRPRSPSSHGQFGRVTPLPLYADTALYCPIHRASSTNLSFIAPDQPNGRQIQPNHSSECRAGQMTRSASGYYGQPEQLAGDPYGVCAAHENFDQQQQHQQLLLMSQLYLATANPKTNSLRRG